MVLQANAAGDTNRIYWAVPHSTTISTPSLGISMCPVSPAVLSLSTSSLSASLSTSPFSARRLLTNPCPLSAVAFFKLYSHCCIIYICTLYIRSGVFVLVFSLCPSLSCLSLSFSSFTRPTLSRKVPPCKPGPARGFFLLKGFFLPLCWPGFWRWVSAPIRHLETIIKGAVQINWPKVSHLVSFCVAYFSEWSRSSYRLYLHLIITSSFKV